MNKKVKELVMVMSSNLLNLIIATAVGFLIPKFLDIEVYAEYKIFTFYISYITLTHLGVNDGLILNILNKSKEEVEKESVLSSIFWVQAIMNMIYFAILLVVVKTFMNNNIYLLILLMIFAGGTKDFLVTAINSNMEFKFQIVMNTIDKIVKVSAVAYIYFNRDSNIPLIYSSIALVYLLMIIRMFYYRKAIFKRVNIKESVKIYFRYMITGAPMMFSYFIGMLAMGLDRVFIENNNTLEEYAYYAFAMSMIVLVAQVITTSSTVVRPYVSRMGDEMRKKSYEILSDFMNVVTGLSALGLIVFPYFIKLVIPNMEPTIILFYYLYPIVVFKIQYSMKHRQFFFIFKKTYQNLFAAVSLLILVFIFNMVVLFNGYGYEYYAFSSLISFIIWNISNELYFNKILNVKIFKSIVFSIILSLAIIYLAFDFENITRIIYFTLIILSSVLLLYSSFIKNIITMIIKKDMNLIKDL